MTKHQQKQILGAAIDLAKSFRALDKATWHFSVGDVPEEHRVIAREILIGLGRILARHVDEVLVKVVL